MPGTPPPYRRSRQCVTPHDSLVAGLGVGGARAGGGASIAALFPRRPHHPATAFSLAPPLWTLLPARIPYDAAVATAVAAAALVGGCQAPPACRQRRVPAVALVDHTGTVSARGQCWRVFGMASRAHSSVRGLIPSKSRGACGRGRGRGRGGACGGNAPTPQGGRPHVTRGGPGRARLD